MSETRDWFSIQKDGPLGIEADRDGDSLVVRALGEVDISTAPTLESSLKWAEEQDASAITLDLTQVRFMDSMGLHVLLSAAAYSREHGDRLRIDVGSGAVRKLIELTGTGDALPLSA